MGDVNEIQLDLLKKSNLRKYESYLDLLTLYEEKYEKPAEFICRAPGRVNLIGEHIDYCGYSVLPMAVSQDVTMVVSRNKDNMIRLSNVEKSFSDYKSSIMNFIIGNSIPKWHEYILCGVKGILEYESMQNPVGMDILVHGTVPKAAGMSSSSALVCVAALATSYSNTCGISRHVLAEECAKCEQYIGTQGGGMDQSISFLAERGKAKFISFNPLTAVDVNMPKGAMFVITNTGVKMNKAATAHFNVRVAECKIATQILAKKKGLDILHIKKFLDVQTNLKASFDEMLRFVDNVLHPAPYTREEICKLLAISDDQLKMSLLSKNTENVTTFKLYQRAKHVFSEAKRVHLFKAACDESSDDILYKLGELMNESHASCNELYECSCEELNELTALCRKSGALGSRLTGAGWGGCAVSLVSCNNLEQFIGSVKEGYYKNTDEATLHDVLFATEPGDGAAVYTV